MTASTSETAVAVVSMPRLSDSMEEGTIVRWLLADGEFVSRGQEMVEIETDKATMSYEAPAGGPLRILVGAGGTAAVGDPIARIGGDRDFAASGTATAIRISPIARRLAVERGIDLATVTGTGPRGRVLKEDVLRAGASRGDDAAPAAPPGPAVLTGARGSARRQALTRTQQIVARRMSEARATVPEFPIVAAVEMTAVIELRRQLEGVLQPAPTMNDVLVAAVARTLPAHPRLNAAYVDGGFELFEEVNVGIAVAVDDELLVPVLSGADKLSLAEIATRSRRLVERTRGGAVTPPELAGGTFTISNLGMFGISWFQPIVNPPQAAILGVGGIAPGRAEQPPTMNLTLVSDHRIVYGAHAARFLADLRDLLQSPLALFASR
jgi:pyruvate dehydrogenase E2 component (dihydrolipoamide acetyltransferase)